MRRVFKSLIILIFAVSCSIIEVEFPSHVGTGYSFHATMENNGETKTVLGSEGKILWSPNDKIKLFYGGGGSTSVTLVSDNTEPSLAVNFPGAPANVFELGSMCYAIYPDNELNTYSNSRYTVNLPSLQTAIPGSFDKNLFISIAQTNTENLFFYNVCGGVCFSVTEENITRVSFKGNTGGVIAGLANVSFDSDNHLIINTTSNNDEIVLSAPEGDTFVPGEKYYIVCYPYNLVNGYTMTFTKSDGTVANKTSNRPVQIKRSVWGTVLNADNNLDYIDEAEQRVTEKNTLIELYNSGEGNQWPDYTSSNWCTDKPVSEWHGVTTNASGFIKSLQISDYHGILPESLGSLKFLEKLYVTGQFTGSLPESLADLKNLEVIHIESQEIISDIYEDGLTASNNFQWEKLANLKELTIRGQNLFGNIPEKIGTLDKLEILNLSTNKFSGIIPTSICQLQNLKSLNLESNLLSGSIPNEIGNLISLEELNLKGHSTLDRYENLPDYTNSFSGSIPSTIGQITNLKYLTLDGNHLSGNIPDEIYDLTNLVGLDLSFNNLTGQISHKIGNLQGLLSLDLGSNMMSGSLPDELWTLSNLASLCLSSNFERYGVILTNKNEFSGELSSQISNLINLRELKIVNCGLSGEIPLGLTSLKNLYSLKMNNNDFTGCIPDEFKDMESLSMFWCQGNKLSGYISEGFVSTMNQKNMYSSMQWIIGPQQDGYTFTYDLYESSDYSHHKEVKILNHATKGNGINIVLIGDGFVDTEINNGIYDNVMSLMNEAIFDIEPFRSFREYFNVYQITLVSKNNATSGETVLKIQPDVMFIYTLDKTNLLGIVDELIPNLKHDDLTISIATPFSSTRRGCCYFVNPESQSSTGLGLGVAITQYTDDIESFQSTIRHEVIGHGFGKLGDEYADRGYQSVAPDAERDLINNYHNLNWYANIDIVSDPAQILWHRFLELQEYINSGVGIFEGGDTYANGVWRPTQDSIMKNSSFGIFNAPSREAIFKRINYLAFGDSWVYDFNDFIEWDSKNLSSPTLFNISWNKDDDKNAIVLSRCVNVIY